MLGIACFKISRGAPVENQRARWSEKNQPGVEQETQAVQSDKQGQVPLLLRQSAKVDNTGQDPVPLFLVSGPLPSPRHMNVHYYVPRWLAIAAYMRIILLFFPR